MAIHIWRCQHGISLVHCLTYSKAGYTRLWYHSPPRDIANRNQILIGVKCQVACLSEIDVLSLAHLYHVELKPTSTFTSQEPIAITHVGRFELQKG
jgi:hypothetical protein